MFNKMLPREHYAAFLEEIQGDKITLQVQAEARGTGTRSACQRENFPSIFCESLYIPHVGAFLLPVQT